MGDSEQNELRAHEIELRIKRFREDREAGGARLRGVC